MPQFLEDLAYEYDSQTIIPLFMSEMVYIATLWGTNGLPSGKLTQLWKINICNG